MIITASIKISGAKSELKTLFEAENSSFENDRASYFCKAKKNDFLITIKAEDATAFRAMINSISKLISLYEKTDAVIKNEN